MAEARRRPGSSGRQSSPRSSRQGQPWEGEAIARAWLGKKLVAGAQRRGGQYPRSPPSCRTASRGPKRAWHRTAAPSPASGQARVHQAQPSGQGTHCCRDPRTRNSAAADVGRPPRWSHHPAREALSDAMAERCAATASVRDRREVAEYQGPTGQPGLNQEFGARRVIDTRLPSTVSPV